MPRYIRSALLTAVLILVLAAVVVVVTRDDGEPTSSTASTDGSEAESTGPTPPGEPGEPPNPTDPPPGTAVVAFVVDGDTVIVELEGDDDVHVRLIGIDTPETVDPDSPAECYGPEASRHLADLLPRGTAVRLVRDVEARDQYDRLLAYVYRSSDGLFVNLAQVAGGYAEALSFPPNTAHRADFDRAERQARSAGAGLWGACGDADTQLQGSDPPSAGLAGARR